MQELYRSELLRALGWAITDSFWQMSLLWMVYQVLIAIPFRKKPAVKHLGALLMLLLGTVAFIYSFIGRLSEESRNASPVAGSSADVSISITNIFNSSLPYFSTAYLLILVLLLARLIYNFTATQKLKSDFKPAINWQLLVNQLTVRMGISRDVFIYVSEQVSIPSTIGYLKPIILLPLATLNQLSTEQLEAVIIHEMAHIRRNDYLVNLVVAFIETLLFFNPFAHLLARTIRKECELCCDDEVIRQQDPEAYVQALLLLERSKLRPAMAMAVTGKQGMLLGRVKRILNIPDEQVKYRHKLGALVLLAALIMLIAILAPSKISEQDREKTNIVKKKVVTGEPSNVPLPFIVKIPPAPETPSKSKARIKEKRIVTTPLNDIKQSEKIKEFEFVFSPDIPVPPMHPSVPPPPAHPEELNRFFDKQVLVFRNDDLAMVAEAPDPRDRKSTDILRRTKSRAAQPEMNEQDIYRRLTEQVLQNRWTEEAEKLGESIAKAKDFNEQMIRINGQYERIGDLITSSPSQVKIKKRSPQRSAISVPGVPVKPIIKAVPAEEGMTITIIQNDEQIEIRVKDSH